MLIDACINRRSLSVVVYGIFQVLTVRPFYRRETVTEISVSIKNQSQSWNATASKAWSHMGGDARNTSESQPASRASTKGIGNKSYRAYRPAQSSNPSRGAEFEYRSVFGGPQETTGSKPHQSQPTQIQTVRPSVTSVVSGHGMTGSSRATARHVKESSSHSSNTVKHSSHEQDNALPEQTKPTPLPVHRPPPHPDCTICGNKWDKKENTCLRCGQSFKDQSLLKRHVHDWGHQVDPISHEAMEYNYTTSKWEPQKRPDSIKVKPLPKIINVPKQNAQLSLSEQPSHKDCRACAKQWDSKTTCLRCGQSFQDAGLLTKHVHDWAHQVDRTSHKAMKFNYYSGKWNPIKDTGPGYDQSIVNEHAVQAILQEGMSSDSAEVSDPPVSYPQPQAGTTGNIPPPSPLEAEVGSLHEWTSRSPSPALADVGYNRLPQPPPSTKQSQRRAHAPQPRTKPSNRTHTCLECGRIERSKRDLLDHVERFGHHVDLETGRPEYWNKNRQQWMPKGKTYRFTKFFRN